MQIWFAKHQLPVQLEFYVARSLSPTSYAEQRNQQQVVFAMIAFTLITSSVRARTSCRSPTHYHQCNFRSQGRVPLIIGTATSADGILQ
jgi:hypothetical protein